MGACDLRSKDTPEHKAFDRYWKAEWCRELDRVQQKMVMLHHAHGQGHAGYVWAVKGLCTKQGEALSCKHSRVSIPWARPHKNPLRHLYWSAAFLRICRACIMCPDVKAPILKLQEFSANV